MHGAAAIAGIGESSYYERGQSPHTEFQLACIAIPAGIIYAPEEAYEDEHFVARGFQVEVEQPELGRCVRYPGAPYVFEKTKWAISRPAPRVGQRVIAPRGDR